MGEMRNFFERDGEYAKIMTLDEVINIIFDKIDENETKAKIKNDCNTKFKIFRADLSMITFPNCHEFMEKLTGIIQGKRILNCCKMECDPIINIQNGWIMETDFNNNFVRKFHFLNGQKHGPSKVVHDEGNYHIVNYKNGKQHGKRTYYYGNGNKWQELIMNNGEIDGEGISWYKNGKIKSRFLYKEGKLIKHEEWDESGQPIK